MAAAGVLHVTTGLNVGGAEIMLMRFLAHQDAGRFKPSVVSLMTPGPIAAHIERRGIPVTSMDMAPGKLYPANLIGLRSAIRATVPQLYHGWMYHGNLVASLASMANGKPAPVIWSIHHSLHDIENEKPLTATVIKTLARMSRHAFAISYCSRIAADHHERYGFDTRRRVVIPNGVDCDEFSPGASARARLRALIDIPDARLIIGNFARFHPMKDQVRLVEATAQLAGRGVDVQALFIGDGHENNVLSRRAHDLGIGDRVSILGVRTDIKDIAPGLDAFAMTSSWGESFSLAAAEAMACGVPAIVTDIGDCAWVVGDASLVARPNDTESVAAALERLLRLTPEERRAIGLNARARMLEHFSMREYVRRHTELYAHAVEEGAASRLSKGRNHETER
ncbi:MAG: glycosyltransferase [Parvularculaceae bacterium]